MEKLIYLLGEQRTISLLRFQGDKGKLIILQSSKAAEKTKQSGRISN